MRLSRTIRVVLLVLAGIAVLWAAGAGVLLVSLPPVRPLADPRISLTIPVRDWRGKAHPFVVGPKNPHWTPISAVPSSLKKAVIAAEDANFYAHEGVDYEAIREAIKADVREGRFIRGGSTITQQLAKNLFLSRDKTLSRKVKEYVLARRIEKRLTKARILELYLNVVELGPMVYGVGSASRYYFGKPPSALSLRESAFLASMLPGPKIYNPYRNLRRVVRRSDRILRRMRAAGMITGEEYRAALAEEPNVEGLVRKVEVTIAAEPPAGTPTPGPPEEAEGDPPRPADEGDASGPVVPFPPPDAQVPDPETPGAGETVPPPSQE